VCSLAPKESVPAHVLLHLQLMFSRSTSPPQGARRKSLTHLLMPRPPRNAATSQQPNTRLLMTHQRTRQLQPSQESRRVSNSSSLRRKTQQRRSHTSNRGRQKRVQVGLGQLAQLAAAVILHMCTAGPTAYGSQNHDGTAVACQARGLLSQQADQDACICT
jgi:hypothetical protein